MIEGLIKLLMIHLMIAVWVLCFIGLLAVTALTLYEVFHFIYLGEQQLAQRFHHGGLRH